MAELTVERLREVLHYNAETGRWTWRVKASNMTPGMAAGGDKGDGYRRIKIDGCSYRAARLAFFYMKGRWPHPEIDHINRDRADDRWENLRQLSHRLNSLNRGLHSNNTSGFKGVCWDKHQRKWVSQTRVNYRRINLGTFNTKEEAHQAYLDYYSTK